MNSNSEGHEFETHIVDWMNTENNVNEVEKVSTKFRQLVNYWKWKRFHTEESIKTPLFPINYRIAFYAHSQL